MPYEIRRGYEGCAFAVVKATDGKRMGCHSSYADARRQMAALYANEPAARKDVTADVARLTEDPEFWAEAKRIMVGAVQPIFLEAYLAGREIALGLRVKRVRGRKYNAEGNPWHDPETGQFSGPGGSTGGDEPLVLNTRGPWVDVPMHGDGPGVRDRTAPLSRSHGANLDGFRREFAEWGSPNPLRTREIVKGNAGVVLTIDEDGVYIDEIRSLRQGSNDVITMMVDLTQMADRNGMPMHLLAQPFTSSPKTGLVGGNPLPFEKLVQFYEHFGFRNEYPDEPAPKTGPGYPPPAMVMIRPPKTPAQKAIEEAFEAVGLKFNPEGNPWHDELGRFTGPGGVGGASEERTQITTRMDQPLPEDVRQILLSRQKTPVERNVTVAETMPNAVRQVEDNLRAKLAVDGIEHWQGVDRDGNLIEGVDGTERSVFIPRAKISRATELDAHCHPDSASFSQEDVSGAARRGEKMIMVVTPKYTATLSPKMVDANGDGVWNELNIAIAYNAARQSGLMELDYRRYVERRPMSTGRSNNGWHQVWQAVADAADLTYEIHSPDGRPMEVKEPWAAPTLVHEARKEIVLSKVYVYA